MSDPQWVSVEADMPPDGAQALPADERANLIAECKRLADKALYARAVLVAAPVFRRTEAWRSTADDLLRTRASGPTLRRAAHLLQNAYLFVRKAAPQEKPDDY